MTPAKIRSFAVALWLVISANRPMLTWTSIEKIRR